MENNKLDQTLQTT